MGNTALAGKEVIPIPRRQTKAKRHEGKMEKRQKGWSEQRRND